MGGDPLKKVMPGDPFEISARTHANWQDAARDYLNRKLKRSRTPQPQNKSAAIRKCENNTGADRDEFEVVGVESVIFDHSDNAAEFKHRYALKGQVPVDPTHAGRFGILQQPVAAGKICPEVVFAGLTVAKINVLDEDHDRADIANGTCAYLESGTGGSATILYKESGTGVKWAIIRIGAASGLLEPFELKDDLLYAGSSADAYRMTWSDDTDEYEPDLSDVVEVHDPIGMFIGRGRVGAATSSSGDEGVRGFRGWMQQHGGRWEIVYLERGVEMFFADIDMGTVKRTTDEIEIDVATVHRMQATDSALWYTRDGEPPAKVANPLGLTSISPGPRKGEIRLWWKSIADLPDDWAQMDGGANSAGSAIDLTAGATGVDDTNNGSFVRARDDSSACDNTQYGRGYHNHFNNTQNTSLTVDVEDAGGGNHTANTDEVKPGVPGDNVYGFTETNDPNFDHKATVTPNPHQHGINNDDLFPPYKRLHFIEYMGDDPADLKRVLCAYDDTFGVYVAIQIGANNMLDNSSSPGV